MIVSRRTMFIGVASLTAIGSTKASFAQSKKRVGLMIYDTTIPFYSNLMRTATDTAGKHDLALDIQNGNSDLSTQISVVQQFIAQQVDMIMVAPSDPQGIIPVIRQATSAGIPVMAVNMGVDTNSGVNLVNYVGCDDYLFGKHQGELIVKAIGEKGKIALILGVLGSAPQIKRQAGVMDTLKNYSGITVLDTQTATWDNAKALAVTQDFLSRYPRGAIDAIVDQGPEGVNGANFAAENGRTDVKFIMGDYPVDVRNAIIKGTVFGTVDQDPSPEGRLAVEDAAKWLSGDRNVTTPNHYIELVNITKENVEMHPAAWGA